MNEEIKKLMTKINNWIKDILKEKYVGIYFHGSLRLGSYNPNKSDLDFIIVINYKIDFETKKRICDRMLENRALFPKKGFEFSVVLEKYCHDFIYPTPYELHMSEAWIEKYQADITSVINDNYKTDNDLASHFNVINIPNKDMDFGKPSQDVFAIVPKEYVFKSNWNDIKDSEAEFAKNPTYTILNICRFYAFIKDNLTLSKYEGGKWALKNLDLDSKDIIELAIHDYTTEKNVNYNYQKLYNFIHKSMKMLRIEINKYVKNNLEK